MELKRRVRNIFNLRMAGLATILFLTNVSFADTLIRVRPHVVAKPGSEVRLAQLVDAQGISSETETVLQSTSMTKAPAFGEKQELSQASLMEVLRPLVKNERRREKGSVHLLLPNSVIIDTLKRDLTTDAVWTELKQVWQPLCSDCQLDVEGLSLPAIQGVRDWSLKIKAELPRGSFSIPVSIVRADSAPVSAWVSGRLLVKRKVPVAKREIGFGERLQAKDVDWEFRDTTFAMDGIPSPDALGGQKIRRAVRAGDILWAGNLEIEKAIHRGELVQVKSSEGSWEVSMSVVAQQDAVVGDTINLKNPKTNSSLMGVVTGQGEVELR